MIRYAVFTGAAIAGLAVAASACSGPRSALTYDVRDSAGVKLVSNGTRGAWARDSVWRLVQSLRIATSESDPDYQIGKVGGIAVTSSGDILVLDALGHNIHEYDSAGTFVRTFGGAGNGPGQLSTGASTVLVGAADSILVPDLGNLRVDIYAPDGAPVRSFPLSIAGGVPIAWAVMPTGALLEQVKGLTLPGQAANPRNDLLTLDTDGTVRDTLLHLPLGFVPDMSKGPAAMKLRFFEPQGVWASVSEGRIIAGTSSTYRLSVYDAGGRLHMVVSKPAVSRPVTEADQREFTRMLRSVVTTQMGRIGGDRAKAIIEQMISNVEYAKEYPVLGVIRGGPDGTFLVQHIATLDADADGSRATLTTDGIQLGAREWDVFDRGGRFLGVIRFPAGFRLEAVRGDAFFGFETDSLDVPAIIRLVRRPAGRTD